jgi:hypothetical protein
MQLSSVTDMRAGVFILTSDVPYHKLNEDERRDIGRRWSALKGGYLPPPREKDCPPRPEDGLCECCGESTFIFSLDHCHETAAFRGWVCSPCNTGHGIMDNVERLKKRIAFLEARRKEQRIALIRTYEGNK